MALRITRVLKAALVERQALVARIQLSGASLFSKTAELWFEEFEKLVDTSMAIISGVMQHALRLGAAVINPVREVTRIDGTQQRRPGSLVRRGMATIDEVWREGGEVDHAAGVGGRHASASSGDDRSQGGAGIPKLPRRMADAQAT